MKILKISQDRPWEADETSFLDYHSTGYISEEAYDKYNQEGGLSWLGSKDKYPILLETRQFRDKIIEFRQTGEKLQYTQRHPDDALEHIRDENGDLVYMSEEQMMSQELPMVDTTIVAFYNDKPIGLASDEFGTDGIWVDSLYQQHGIGTYLLHLLRNQFKPERKIGQMTPLGRDMARAYYRRYVNPQ